MLLMLVSEDDRTERRPKGLSIFHTAFLVELWVLLLPFKPKLDPHESFLDVIELRLEPPLQKRE